MFKFAIIFVIGLLIIHYIHSEETTLPTDTALLTTEITSTTTTSLLTLPESSTAKDAVTTVLDVQTNKESTITEMTSAMIITECSFIPLFQCDFNSACFGNDQLIRTNGNEFNPDQSSNGLEPPRAPTSDVTSITTPTSNNETCDLPYTLSLDNNMNTTYWFCYNNTCKTESGDTATCAPGLYGLVSLSSSESSKTIIGSVDYNSILRDSVGEQYLRFYYYFTIYDGEDWGQQIQVWIRPNNQSDNAFLIRSLTILDMKGSGWQFQNTTFNSTFSNYTARSFSFIVGKENRTEDSSSNQTVYFALDNIELYDFNCSDVNNQVTTSTTTPAMVTTTISTSIATPSSLSTATTSAPPKQNLGLILGLSLGLGIPFVLGVLIGFIYCFKVYRPKHRVNVVNTNNTTTAAVTDIPLKPTKTKSKKNTKSSAAV